MIVGWGKTIGILYIHCSRCISLTSTVVRNFLTTSFTLRANTLFPVDTRRRFNVGTMSCDVARHRVDVETASCVYWNWGYFMNSIFMLTRCCCSYLHLQVFRYCRNTKHIGTNFNLITVITSYNLVEGSIRLLVLLWRTESPHRIFIVEDFCR